MYFYITAKWRACTLLTQEVRFSKETMLLESKYPYHFGPISFWTIKVLLNRHQAVSLQMVSHGPSLAARYLHRASEQLHGYSDWHPGHCAVHMERHSDVPFHQHGPNAMQSLWLHNSQCRGFNPFTEQVSDVWNVLSSLHNIPADRLKRMNAHDCIKRSSKRLGYGRFRFWK